MVASISARGNAKAALAYYDHLRQDDYYTAEDEPPGRWGGSAAARLSLQGPVTQSEFDAALNGLDPKTGERLVQRGGQAQSHAAGWDMTFSAPKSVSVLWALSEPEERAAIEAAQQRAVMAATRHLEKEAAWSRRGQGGKCREQAAGLLTAQFDHYTSRELDPHPKGRSVSGALFAAGEIFLDGGLNGPARDLRDERHAGMVTASMNTRQRSAMAFPATERTASDDGLAGVETTRKPPTTRPSTAPRACPKLPLRAVDGIAAAMKLAPVRHRIQQGAAPGAGWSRGDGRRAHPGGHAPAPPALFLYE